VAGLFSMVGRIQDVFGDELPPIGTIHKDDFKKKKPP
jgi:hypothetical protein